MWRLWMSQSWFSLGFLSQYSLWKLSIFRGYKGYLYWSVFGMRTISFSKQNGWRLGLVTWLGRQFKPRTNWMASLDFLSCNAPIGMTLQLLHMLGTCATSGSLQAASYLRDLVTSPCYFAQTWAFLHTLSHTTLTWFPPKYRVTNC